MRENIKIRLEGSPQKIEKAVKRLRQVFSITKESDLHDSRFDQNIYLCYLTVYMYDPGNLYDSLANLRIELQEAQDLAGELSLENQKLKEQLDLVPKPGPYDVVLGNQIKNP